MRAKDPLPAHAPSSTLCRWVLGHEMPSCSFIVMHSATLYHQALPEDTEAFPAHSACMNHTINTRVCCCVWKCMKKSKAVQLQQLLLPPVKQGWWEHDAPRVQVSLQHSASRGGRRSLNTLPHTCRQRLLSFEFLPKNFYSMQSVW